MKNQILTSKNLKSKSEMKQADKIDEGIDGLGTINNISKNTEASTQLIVNGSPFKVVQCNQIVMFEAEYIENLKDFRKRVKGFYMANVYSVHLFKEKNAETLIHSVNYSQMNKVIAPLKGAKGCLILDGGKVSADLTICFKLESDSFLLLEAFNKFAKCRKGDNLVQITADQAKELAKACTENSEGNEKSENPDNNLSSGLKVNNWDVEREKYFHPLPAVVPGTPIKKNDII